MSSKVPVLYISLKVGHAAFATHPGIVSGQYDAGTLPDEYKKMVAAIDASPYAMENAFVEPKDDLKDVEAKLKEKPWKGIVVGYALRGHHELTSLFEQVIHLALKNAPQAVLCFNTYHRDTLPSLERNVPV